VDAALGGAGQDRAAGLGQVQAQAEEGGLLGGQLAQRPLLQPGGHGVVHPGLGQPPGQLQLQRVHGE
jgi:hypothetical protein